MPEVRFDVFTNARQAADDYVQQTERIIRSAERLASSQERAARALTQAGGGDARAAQVARATRAVEGHTRAVAAEEAALRRRINAALTDLSTLGGQDRAYAQLTRSQLRRATALGQEINLSQTLARVNEQLTASQSRQAQAFSLSAVNSRDLRRNMLALNQSMLLLSTSFGRFSPLAIGAFQGITDAIRQARSEMREFVAQSRFGPEAGGGGRLGPQIAAFGAGGAAARPTLGTRALAAAGGPLGIATAAGIAGATGGLALLVGRANDLNVAFKEVSAITGIVGERLENLRDTSIRLSADSTKSTIEIAEAFKLVASAAPELIETTGGLEELTRATILLSEASGDDLPASVAAVVNTLTQFELQASDASRVVDALAAGAQAGRIEIPELASAIARVGAEAQSAGIPLEDLIALIETAGRQGQPLEITATGLRSILQSLRVQGRLRPGDDIADVFERISNEALSAEESIALYQRRFSGLGEFLERSVPQLREMQKATRDSGLAAEASSRRLDTLSGAALRADTAWGAFLDTLATSEPVSAAEKLVVGLVDAVALLGRELTTFVQSGNATLLLNILGQGIIGGPSGALAAALAATASARSDAADQAAAAGFVSRAGQFDALGLARFTPPAGAAPITPITTERGQELIAQLEREIELARLSARERAVRTAEIRAGNDATAEEIARVGELAGLLFDEEQARNRAADAARQQSRALEEIREAERRDAEGIDRRLDEAERAAQRSREAAADRAAERIERPFQNAADNIQTALADSIFNGLNGQITTVEDFADTMKDILLRAIAEVSAALIFQPVIAGVQGTGGIGGSIGGIGGFLGGLFGGGGGGAQGLTAREINELNAAGLGGRQSDLLTIIGGGGGSAGAGLGRFVAPALGGIAGASILIPGAINAFGATSAEDILAGSINGIIGGGIAGAAIGSVVPGIGTAIGGLIGAIAGDAILGTISSVNALSNSDQLTPAEEGVAIAQIIGGLPTALVAYAVGSLFNFGAPNASGIFDTLAPGEAVPTTPLGPVGTAASPFGTVASLYEKRTAGGTGIVDAIARFDEFVASLLLDRQEQIVGEAIQAAGQVGFSARRAFGPLNLEVLLASRLAPGLSALLSSELPLAEGTDPREIVDRLVGAPGGTPEDLAERIQGFVEGIDSLALGIRQLSGEEITPAEQAIRQLQDSFGELSRVAAGLGVDINVLSGALESGIRTIQQDILAESGAAILGILDPFAAQIAAFDEQAAERIRNAEAAGLETILIERRNLLERNRLIEQLTEQANASIQQVVDRALFSTSSPLALETVLANTEERFRQQLSLAEGGDFTARQGIGVVAQELLDARRAFFGSSGDFFGGDTGFTQVIDSLQGILDTVPSIDTGAATSSNQEEQTEQIRILISVVEGVLDQMGSLNDKTEDQTQKIDELSFLLSQLKAA